MKFGQRLGGAQLPGLRYINYDMLKELIKDLSTLNHGESSDQKFANIIAREANDVSTNFLRIECDLNGKYDALIDFGDKSAAAYVEAIVSFMAELSRVREYVTWNYMAVIKIIKKYNKNMAPDSAHQHLKATDILMQQPFYRSCTLAKLTTKSEALLCKTSAFKKIPRENIQCSICLDVLEAPVLLSCTHRFCWKCLSTASRSSDACPVCRKADALALCPANFEVDAGLSALLEDGRFRSEIRSPVGPTSDSQHEGSSSCPPGLIPIPPVPSPPTKDFFVSFETATLGENALETLVNPPTDWEGISSSDGVSVATSYLTNLNLMYNVSTLYSSRECSFSPQQLFMHLRQVESLSPFYHLGPHQIIASDPPAKLPTALPEHLRSFDSQVTQGYETNAGGQDVSIVHSSFINTQDMSSLNIFEYSCRCKKFQGPWLLVAAHVQPSTTDGKSTMTIVVQLDLNSVPVMSYRLHGCNLVERIVQAVFVESISSSANVRPPPMAQTPSLVAPPCMGNIHPESNALLHPHDSFELEPPAKRACHDSGISGSHQGTPPPRDVGQKFDRFGRIMWTDTLHDIFLQAIEELGIYLARPKAIHKLMNVQGITVEHIKSHLQMYRASVKQACKTRSADNVSVQIVRDMKNSELTPHLATLKDSSDEVVSTTIESIVRGVASSSSAQVEQITPLNPNYSMATSNSTNSYDPLHPYVAPQPDQSMSQMMAANAQMQSQIQMLTSTVQNLQSAIAFAGMGSQNQCYASSSALADELDFPVTPEMQQQQLAMFQFYEHASQNHSQSQQ